MARGTNSPKRKGMSYTKFGYIFIAPFVIVYCIFSLYPLLTTFWYSGANMTSTTANFWGFGDKEVFYDRYLDITGYYSDLEADANVSVAEYNKIKWFFQAQDQADLYKPLNASGINQIMANGTNSFVSQNTLDLLKQCADNNTMEYMTDDAIEELRAWRTNYNAINAETTGLQGAISSINGTLTGIVNPVEAEESSDAEPITPDSIVAADNFAAFIDTLTAADFDENQTILVDYLTSLTDESSLADYFTAVSENSALISDPTFYYICTRLQNPNAVVGEESISAITVPFYADVTTYLSTNEWADTINALPSFSSLEAYANGTTEIPSGADSDVYADLEALNNNGIINKVKLEYDGTTLVPAEDKASNVLYALENYAPTPVTDTERLSAMQISAITGYWDCTGRQNMIKFFKISIDAYITFNGDFNIDKYNAYKQATSMTAADGSTTTLAAFFTMDYYNGLDAAKKQACVDQAKLDKAAAEAELPAAEAALNAAIGTDGENAAREALATVRNAIKNANEKINCPVGILSKVDASKEYLFVGARNFNEIFTSAQRRNTVFGAFVSTFIMWLIGFAPQIALALLLSAWFTDTKLHLKGLNLMKALMYLPNVITAVTVAIFFRRIFGYSTNLEALPVSQVIVRAFTGHGYNFFQKAWATRFIICFINFWMWYGNTMIVLIAGITSINESLYESAQIDGANSFQTYTKITMPLLRPILLYTMVTSMIGGLQMYDIPQNVNMNPALINFNGTYIKSTQTVLMYVNALAFGKSSVKQVGIASATSIILFVVTTILSVLIFYLMRDKDAAKAAKAKKAARKAGATK